MFPTKMIIKSAMKLQKMAALENRSFRISMRGIDAYRLSSLQLADKGHFVIYTMDRRRFSIPFSYLNNNIVLELFKRSEEEFGPSSDGPIMFPCDAVLINYIVCLIQQDVATNL
ncbi:hypothetical protein SLEP1_g33601 [Rubroshorea leprosula]|uniref:Small auxin up regulated protein n=1 Tax=Rubroshorea leprosula TaxID=152421 RepID=A0AAV5KH99_9ROSI|nr:hypothetical protein SLEP1_g33601 [Rubroshorea leprosula]